MISLIRISASGNHRACALCASPNFKIQLVSVRKSLPERDSLFSSCPMDPSSASCPIDPSSAAPVASAAPVPAAASSLSGMVARSLDCLEPPRAQAAATWARVGGQAKAGDGRRLHPGCAAGANPTARPAAPSTQSRASGRACMPPLASSLCINSFASSLRPAHPALRGRQWRTRLLCPMRASAAERHMCAGRLHGCIVHADGAARFPRSQLRLAPAARCFATMSVRRALLLLLLSLLAVPSPAVVRAAEAELHAADSWDSSVCGGGWAQYAAMHRDVLAGEREGAPQPIRYPVSCMGRGSYAGCCPCRSAEAALLRCRELQGCTCTSSPTRGAAMPTSCWEFRPHWPPRS